VDGALIEYSVAHDNGQNNDFAGGGPVGIWAWDSNDVTIQFNESYSNHSKTLDGGGFDIDGGVTHSVMQYNYSHDNHGPGFLFAEFAGARPLSNDVVRYNISQNDSRGLGQGAIHFWNGNAAADLADIAVYNNTIFMSPNGQAPVPFQIATPTSNLVIANNVFVTTGGLGLVRVEGSQVNAVLRGNAYWTTGGAFTMQWGGASYADLASFRAATGQESDGSTDYGMFAEPLLTAPGMAGTLDDATQLGSLTSYQLGSTSPLVNAGLDLFASFAIQVGSRDFWGNPVPSGLPDIGADESQGQ
jgi:hypothetical protein